MTAHFLVVILLLSLFGVSATFADTKIITSEAVYTMGDGETPFNAEAMVLQKAKQMALEQAGTYVESYTKVQNYTLTEDEIQIIAGGVLQTEVLTKKRDLIGDGTRFYIKIKATVTTDKIQDLAKRIKGKNEADEYKKLQEDYSRLSKEFEGLKQLVAKTPAGPEREAVLDQIREREKTFVVIQKREDNLLERLVSGEALLAQAEIQMARQRAAASEQHACLQKSKEALNALRLKIPQDFIITVGEPEVAVTSQNPNEATLTVPMTAKASKTLQSDVAEANHMLCLNKTEYVEKNSVVLAFQARLNSLSVVLESILRSGKAYICQAIPVQKLIDLDLDEGGHLVLVERQLSFRATMKIPHDALRNIEKVRGRVVEGNSGPACTIF